MNIQAVIDNRDQEQHSPNNI